MSDLTSQLRAKVEQVRLSRILVGESIRCGLEIDGLSQAALAEGAGLTAKHVSQLMTGKVPLSVDVALRLESVLPSVSAEDLMVTQAREQVREAKAAK